MTELPGGGMRLNIEGLASPLRLGVVQEELLLRVKVGWLPLGGVRGKEQGRETADSTTGYGSAQRVQAGGGAGGAAAEG